MPIQIGQPERQEQQQRQSGGIRIGKSTETTAERVAFMFLRPFNELVVGLPEEVVFRGLEATGVVEQGARRPLASLFGLDLRRGENEAMEPQNDIERDALAAGQMFTTNIPALIPQFQAAKLATQAPKALAPALTERVRNSILSFIQNHPKGAALMEQLSATGAGLAEEEARQAGAPELGQVGAGVVGGLAPGVAFQVARHLPTVLGIRLIKKYIRESPQRTREAAGRALTAGLDNQGEANLAEADRVFSSLGIEGRPTIAEATGAPNLIAKQRSIEQAATGPTLNQLTRRKLDLSEEILTGNRFAPEITGRDPDVLFDTTQQRVSAVRRQVNQQTDIVRTEQEALAGNLRPVDRSALGETLRSQRDSLRTTAGREFRERADEIGLNDLERGFKFNGFRSQVADKYFTQGSRFADSRKPRVLNRLRQEEVQARKLDQAIEKAEGDELLRLQAQRAKLGKVTFEDLQTLRQTVNDEYSEALVAGERNKVRLLAELRNDLDDYIDNVDPTDPELARAWRAFRSDYREQFINRFERGTAFRIGHRDRRGDYRIADERVADAFLESETAARDYKRLFGDDPDALVAARSTTLDKAWAAPGVMRDDGTLNPEALSRWTRKQRWLDEFPSVRDELLDLSSAQRALSARQNQLRQRAVRLDRLALSSALGGDVDGFVSAALKDPKVARTVSITARREKKQDALVASVWGAMLRDLDVDPGALPNPARLLTWVNRNERGLNTLLRDAPEHLQAIRDVYSALAIVQRTPMPQGQAEALGGLERLEQMTGTGIPQVSSRVFAAQSGRVGYRYMAVDALSRLFNRISQRRQDALLFEALFDERLARDLMRSQRIKNEEAVERRLRGWLFVLGLPEESRFGEEE